MTMRIPEWSIDYPALLQEAGIADYDKTADFLLEELPFAWYEKYKCNCSHEININRISLNTFEYIFDECSATETEARLVAVAGRSAPSDKSRRKDDNRLKGWLGPTESVFGKEWDKGHFIAHSIGGAVDGTEINIFPQRRAVNRGNAGEVMFREMENYCAEHSGTFCFNRPIYQDHSARPSFYEFGVLKTDLSLWVNVFDNR